MGPAILCRVGRKALWCRVAQARFPISEEDSKILQVLQVSRERAGEGTGYGALEEIRLEAKLSSHSQLLALMLGGDLWGTHQIPMILQVNRTDYLSW